MKHTGDIHIYSIQNVLRQIEGREDQFGFYAVRFYVTGSRPSRTASDRIETFFYYPSGGTLRDTDLNIVFYEPRLDRYHTLARQVKKGNGDEDAGGIPQ